MAEAEGESEEVNLQELYYHIHKYESDFHPLKKRISRDELMRNMASILQTALTQILVKKKGEEKAAIFYHINDKKAQRLENESGVRTLMESFKTNPNVHTMECFACGHILLGFLFYTLKAKADLYGQAWDFYDTWNEFQTQVESQSLLDPKAKCDKVKNFDWIKNVCCSEYFSQFEVADPESESPPVTVKFLRPHLLKRKCSSEITKEFIAIYYHVFVLLGLISHDYGAYANFYCWSFRPQTAPLVPKRFIEFCSERFNFNRIWGGALLKVLIRMRRLIKELPDEGEGELKKMETKGLVKAMPAAAKIAPSVAVSAQTLRAIRSQVKSLKRDKWSRMQAPEVSHKNWVKVEDQKRKKTWVRMVGQQWRLGWENCQADYAEFQISDKKRLCLRYVLVKQILCVKKMTRKKVKAKRIVKNS